MRSPSASWRMGTRLVGLGNEIGGAWERDWFFKKPILRNVLRFSKACFSMQSLKFAGVLRSWGFTKKCVPHPPAGGWERD
ncbi:MAG: hypothetical protein U9P79_06675 [Candidatus Cloacimonadota bacterium]|nr:hypothetical protein [Candidatus Cloacimonadota bacterium]